MFNNEYKKFQKKINLELCQIQKIINKSVSIKEPLKSGVIEFLNAPSKKIRVVLPILYLKSIGEKITNKHLELLSVVEIVHNASLIHDDIIDNSDTRRGKKSVSAEFGTKLGVISGDYLLSVAMKILAHIGNFEIIKNFSETLKQMCIGEINQNYDRYNMISIEEYIEKSKNKTAYLFETALLSSVILCNKNYDLKKVSDFGLNFGIAFQIRDDLLNILKTDSSKPSYNDIDEGIYNAPVIYAQGTQDLYKGVEKTRILLNNYVNNAIEALNILPNNEYKTALKIISELLNNE